MPADSYRKLGMELINGSRIEALPGTEKTIRGFSGVDLLIVDEAARVADELYYAVRPMLAVSGGRLMMLSTPFGKRGVFYEEWTGGKGVGALRGHRRASARGSRPGSSKRSARLCRRGCYRPGVRVLLRGDRVDQVFSYKVDREGDNGRGCAAVRGRLI